MFKGPSRWGQSQPAKEAGKADRKTQVVILDEQTASVFSVSLPLDSGSKPDLRSNGGNLSAVAITVRPIRASPTRPYFCSCRSGLNRLRSLPGTTVRARCQRRTYLNPAHFSFFNECAFVSSMKAWVLVTSIPSKYWPFPTIIPSLLMALAKDKAVKPALVPSLRRFA